MKNFILALLILICSSFVGINEGDPQPAANSTVLLHLKYSVTPSWEVFNDKDGKHQFPNRPKDGWKCDKAYIIVYKNNSPSDTLYLNRPHKPDMDHYLNEGEEGDYYIAYNIDNNAFYTFDFGYKISKARVDDGDTPYKPKANFLVKVITVSM